MIKRFSAKLVSLTLLSLFIFASIFVGVIPTVSAKTDDNWSANSTIHFKPQATSSPTGLSPTQIKAAYNLPPVGGTGTIAIVDAFDCPTVQSDLYVFHDQYFSSLPTPNFEKHMMSSSIAVDAGWALEISLDVQWAYAIAPNAKILLVEANTNSLSDLLAAVTYAKSQPNVVAVSMSWGGGEFSSESLYDSYFTSSSGVGFFASTGDSGAGTIWPSTSPNVVAVGGTTLTFNGGTLLSETGWSGSGGGVSRYEAKPSYQQTFGTSYSRRSVPDISYNADPNSGVPVYDSTPYSGQSGWWQVGGTSAGAPQWAAIQSLGLSATNNNIYQDAKLPSQASYLRDIISGSNGAYSATPGYDLVTGLGSPVTTNFAPTITSDFAISASPSTLSIIAGSQATSTISITTQGGFANQIALTASSNVLSSSFSSNTINGAGTSTLTIGVSTNTPSGSYTITVTGTSGLLSHSTTINVNVPTQPTAPLNLKATPGNVQVTLSWSAPTSNGGSTITGYNIYQSTSKGGETFLTGVGNVLSYVDKSVTNGQAYFYQVTAVNAAGESIKSNEASATPAVPISLKVTVATDRSSYSRGATARITTTVSDGANPVQGASVAVTIYGPRNTVVGTGSGTTSSNGQVTINYRIGFNSSSRGTYTVTATASKTGYQSGTGQTTFQVN